MAERPDTTDLKQATALAAAQPAPDFVSRGIRRWHCADGAVVLDEDTRSAGVYFYPKEIDGPQRGRLSDPAQLVAALRAAVEQVNASPR